MIHNIFCNDILMKLSTLIMHLLIVFSVIAIKRFNNGNLSGKWVPERIRFITKSSYSSMSFLCWNYSGRQTTKKLWSIFANNFLRLVHTWTDTNDTCIHTQMYLFMVLGKPIISPIARTLQLLLTNEWFIIRPFPKKTSLMCTFHSSSLIHSDTAQPITYFCVYYRPCPQSYPNPNSNVSFRSSSRSLSPSLTQQLLPKTSSSGPYLLEVSPL